MFVQPRPKRAHPLARPPILSALMMSIGVGHIATAMSSQADAS